MRYLKTLDWVRNIPQLSKQLSLSVCFIPFNLNNSPLMNGWFRVYRSLKLLIISLTAERKKSWFWIHVVFPTTAAINRRVYPWSFLNNDEIRKKWAEKIWLSTSSVLFKKQFWKPLNLKSDGRMALPDDNDDGWGDDHQVYTVFV